MLLILSVLPGASKIWLVVVRQLPQAFLLLLLLLLLPAAVWLKFEH